MRLLVFSHDDAFIQELAPSGLFDLTRVEEINGEHSLSLTTTEKLEKQQRVLFEDSQSIWHEYVVMGEEQIHSDADEPMNTYYCVWSLQYDLMGLINKTMPGRDNPVTSTVALQHAIQNTERWTVGSVTQNTTSGCSMYYKSGWESLGLVVDNWGGEVTVTIEVDNTKVIARKVNLLNQQGSSEAVRRFDYSADLNQIKRTVDDAPYTCRITPRGQGEEGEDGSFGRRITIESVNDGVEWLQDDEVVDLVKLPDGQGGYEYPNQIVIFEDIQDPQVLKDTALEHLHDYTRPRVTYEADVVQLQRAGLDAKGIALGDVVQVVDKAFKEDGLRVEGRVTQLRLDELDPTKNVVTIGFVPQGLEGQFSSMQASINEIQNWLDIETTPEYITGLIERINTEINATGGYTYLVEGVGIITYDKAVSDPSVGAEADQAVEVRGGSIRIANSKDAQGNWKWETVFTAGHIAGELVTAAQITTGYIGSAGGTFIDLDTNTVQLGDQTDWWSQWTNSGFTLNHVDTKVLEVAGLENAPVFTYGSRVSDSSIGPYSATFGMELIASGHYGVAMGQYSEASGGYSFVAGNRSKASGLYAAVIGSYSEASAQGAIALGQSAKATGDYSAAISYNTTASGTYSFAVGNSAVSSGLAASAMGQWTIAQRAYQTALGAFNVADTAGSATTAKGSYALIVGIGTSDSARKNGFSVDWSGNVLQSGNLTSRFETFDLSSKTNGVSTTQYPTTFNILDSAGRIAVRQEGVILPSGTVSSLWYVRNYNTSGTMVAQKGIRISMTKTGTMSYEFSDVENARSALGYSLSSASPTFSANTGYSIYNISARKRWGVATIQFSFSSTSQIAANSTPTIGKMSLTGYTPDITPAIVSRGSHAVSGYIDSLGNIVIRSNVAIPANNSVVVSTTFLTSDF